VLQKGSKELDQVLKVKVQIGIIFLQNSLQKEKDTTEA
tara:strand:+ start:19495 stop:19608 length:114 start_codon:yes stop_codon:yes gene_type:complete